jgi:hypothetical protein
VDNPPASGKRRGNRDRLPAVCLSVVEWLNDARQTFKLEDEIDDVLENETRGVGRASYSISSLLKNPDHARDDLAKHGIEWKKIEKRLKKRASIDWLIIEEEVRQSWSPDGFPDLLVCNPRKIIPKASYWFLEMKLGVDAMDQLNKAMKDEKPLHYF